MSEFRATPRPVMAYCDRVTYEQGASVQVMAAGRGPVDIDLVRLDHPPDDPSWPVPCFGATDAIESVRVTVEPQDIYSGSYLVVEGIDRLADAEAMTMSLYVLPTRLAAGHVQALWSTMDASGAQGVSVVLEDSGLVSVRWGADGRLVSQQPLVPGRWSVVSVSADESSQQVAMSFRLLSPGPGGIGTWSGQVHAEALRIGSSEALLFGAARLPAQRGALRMPGRPSFGTSFNGKLDSPVLLSGFLASEKLSALTPATAAADIEAVIGAWDLSQNISGVGVVDTGPHGHSGELVNTPARAVTGALWRGAEQNWLHAPDQYTAVHLHDDDLDDARWPVTTTLTLPDDLPSAVYAVRLSEVDGSESDLVPLLVVPSRQQEGGAKVLVVMPSYTYLAYANLRGNGDDLDYVAAGLAIGPPEPPHAGQLRLNDIPEIGGSLYDVHSDNSGWSYSSPLRPILNYRHDWKSNYRDAYRHLCADLYVLGWLDKLGIPYEITTDHVVNKRGADILGKYDVVLTGTHPEYISGAIIDAHESYLGGGGSVLYLGGNGFYWVTTESDRIAEQIEVRRGFTGTRTWTSPPGEGHHSMTGELGGLWRHRGRSPNALLGVGFVAQGADGGAAPYGRAEASRNGPAAFLFDGVTADIIGERGFDMGAAAGDEVDRFSVAHGSPPWATVVASSLPLSSYYKLAVEELQITRENTGGDHEPEVRADLVLVEQDSGGLVFSVGSISWVQSMAIDYFDNDVARVTENALRAALSRRSQVPPS